MDRVEIRKAKALRGEITPPPDKSISHRAVLFSSLAKGKSLVRNFLAAEDPLSTIKAMKMLGTTFELPYSLAMRLAPQQPMMVEESSQESSFDIAVHGRGLTELREPFDVIDCGNSGTTIRLISGILAGNPFFSVLTGDDSLKQRPMARVMDPLKKMGARISGRNNDRYPPIAISGGKLRAVDYQMPVASAQVKSCLILAGLYADGVTSITEPRKSRDHTERMLRSMGAAIEIEGLTVKVTGHGSWDRGRELAPVDITVPGDFSSAAFFMVAALVVGNSDITIKGVGINPTRTGLMGALKKMGAQAELINVRDVSGEPVADIHCRSGSVLKAVRITEEQIPSLIDEFPILCIAASLAEGTTTIRGAEELRVKESDRIKAMASELRKIGVEVEEYPDGLSIKGVERLKGAEVESHGDHRIAMAMAVAGLAAEGETVINGASAVDISFPGFFDIIKRLSA